MKVSTLGSPRPTVRDLRVSRCQGKSWGIATKPSVLTPSPAEVTSETFNKEAFLASRGLTRGYWTQLSMLIPGPGAPRNPWGTTPSLSCLLNGM